ACLCQTPKTFPNIEHGQTGILGNRARTHYRARSREWQVRYRRKIRVEAQGATFFTDDPAMLAKELAVAGGEYVGRGRRRFQRFLQPINQPALHVDTAKQGG